MVHRSYARSEKNPNLMVRSALRGRWVDHLDVRDVDTVSPDDAVDSDAEDAVEDDVGEASEVSSGGEDLSLMHQSVCI